VTQQLQKSIDFRRIELYDFHLRSFKDTVYTAPPPQHTEAQFKVPDWGDKVDFTALLLFWHFFIVFFHCWYTALKGEYFSLFILRLVTFY
jgi:hypothetical protein